MLWSAIELLISPELATGVDAGGLSPFTIDLAVAAFLFLLGGLFLRVRPYRPDLSDVEGASRSWWTGELRQSEKMGKAEAAQLLATELATFRQRGYDDLVRLINAPRHTVQGVSSAGVPYQLHVFAAWDDKVGASVRVVGTLYVGGWSPLAKDSFIKVPDGSLMSENH